jgi:hypothetical protein
MDREALRVAPTIGDVDDTARERVMRVRRSRRMKPPTKQAWSILWDEAGGKPGRVNVTLEWLAYEGGCSVRSAGRQLQDVARVGLASISEFESVLAVDLVDPLDLDALRVVKQPPRGTRPLPIMVDEDDCEDGCEGLGENAAKTPRIRQDDDCSAEARRKRGENAAETPNAKTAEFATANRERTLQTFRQDRDDPARSLLSRTSSHSYPYLNNHPSHSLNPIPPDSSLEEFLRLTDTAQARASRWLRAGRSELGQAILDDAGSVWRQLATSYEETDGWIPVYAAYLRWVEGGLSGEEFGRPLKATRKNATTCKAAYWVAVLKRLLQDRQRPLPWPSIDWLRAEFERIGVGWNPRWDERWQRARQNARDPPAT